jgi:hypothetical protein
MNFEEHLGNFNISEVEVVPKTELVYYRIEENLPNQVSILLSSTDFETTSNPEVSKTF